MKTEGTKGATAKSLNKLMADCEGKPENNLIQMVALRAMMKAKYSVHNIGHLVWLLSITRTLLLRYAVIPTRWCIVY